MRIKLSLRLGQGGVVDTEHPRLAERADVNTGRSVP